MTEISADDYKAFSAKLRTVDKAVARGIRKRIRAAAGPIGRIVIETGSEGMPARGGLKARLMASRPTVSLLSRGAKINLKNKGLDLAALNRGIARHPLFGNRGHWYSTPVPADVYLAALNHLPAAARADLEKVMGDVMKEIGL